MRELAVGIDVGGTKVAAGLVARDGTVLEQTRRDTPADAAAIVPLIAEIVAELTTGVLGEVPVGVGAAGLIDPDGVVRYAPNIAWRDYPLQAEISDALGVPVTVENDANVAAWGEYRAGAARDAGESMVMFTVGTGVGGGLVLGDRLIRGRNGMAAEFGHMIVDEGGVLCPCGNRGCLEAMASGSAIGRLALEALDAGEVPEDSALARIPRAEVSGKRVTRAAHAGDELACDILARCGTWLGVGIASVVHVVDPEIVVVGGGAMEAGELLLAPAREAFAARLLGRAHRPMPPVAGAELADLAGVVGAGLLGRELATS